MLDFRPLLALSKCLAYVQWYIELREHIARSFQCPSLTEKGWSKVRKGHGLDDRECRSQIVPPQRALLSWQQ